MYAAMLIPAASAPCRASSRVSGSTRAWSRTVGAPRGAWRLARPFTCAIPCTLPRLCIRMEVSAAACRMSESSCDGGRCVEPCASGLGGEGAVAEVAADHGRVVADGGDLAGEGLIPLGDALGIAPGGV